MATLNGACPMTRDQVIETYFMEHRAKLLEVAAFLDRLDRSEGDSDDFRMRSFYDALELLTDGKSDRTARLLDLFSDTTEEPIESAAGMKGASGAWPNYEREA